MWEGEKDRKQRLADKRKAELKHLREKLMTGTRDAVLASDNHVMTDRLIGFLSNFILSKKQCKI